MQIPYISHQVILRPLRIIMAYLRISWLELIQKHNRGRIGASNLSIRYGLER